MKTEYRIILTPSEWRDLTPSSPFAARQVAITLLSGEVPDSMDFDLSFGGANLNLVSRSHPAVFPIVIPVGVPVSIRLNELSEERLVEVALSD